MKQVAQNYRSGELAVLDVPAPACKPGGVLVRSLYSLISTGTEMMKVSEARMSLLGKARARPDQVRKVLRLGRPAGRGRDVPEGDEQARLATPRSGYSLCGVVVEVGAGAERVRGRRARRVRRATSSRCTPRSTGCPTNLCVPRARRASRREHAAFATVGAIAMQGVRRAEPQLGETALRHRPRAGRPAGGAAARRRRASGSSASTPSRPGAATGREGGRARPAATPTTRASVRSSAVAEPPAASARTTCFLAAGGGTQRPGRAGRAAGPRPRPGSSTSARPGSTCRGTPTTRRSSTSGSPAPTGPGATTTAYELDGRRLPGRLRALDRAPQPGVLPRPARPRPASTSSRWSPHVADFDDAVDDRTSELADGELKGVGRAVRVPRTTRAGAPGPPAPGGPRPAVRRAAAAARAGRRPARCGWLRRRGQLRDVDAAAAPGASATTSSWSTVVDHDVAVRRPTRSASSASPTRPPTSTPCSTTSPSTRSSSSPGTARTPSWSAGRCSAGKAVFVEKPLALTEERAGRRARGGRGDRQRPAAWSGFNRRFAPLLHRGQDSGSVARDAARRRCATWSTPGRSTRAAGTSNEELEGSRFAGEGGHFIDTLSWLVGADPV